MKLPGTRLVRATAALALACLSSACARTVRVPVSDFSNVEPGKRVHLDVTTVDEHYFVTSFSTTDSTLIIHAVQVGTNVYPSSATKWSTPPAIPYELPFNQVTSLQRVQDAHPVHAAVALTLITGLVVIFAGIVAFGSGWGGGGT